MASNIETIPITAEGYEKLHKELERLKSQDRPNIIEAIAFARSHGDLKENAEYHAAREKQGFIEARINELEEKLSRSEIIDLSKTASLSQDAIRFGAWVELCDEDSGELKKYRLVGDIEADIAQNKLSISSPLGRLLMGRKKSELIELKMPKGTKEYSIVSISF